MAESGILAEALPQTDPATANGRNGGRSLAPPLPKAALPRLARSLLPTVRDLPVAH